MERISHPPYSPDLALCGFHRFGKFKNVWRLRNYVNKLKLEGAIEIACVSIDPDPLRTAFEH
jgi:hypothetical protein